MNSQDIWKSEIEIKNTKGGNTIQKSTLSPHLEATNPQNTWAQDANIDLQSLLKHSPVYYSTKYENEEEAPKEER